MAPDVVLLYGPRRGFFLKDEVPLYHNLKQARAHMRLLPSCALQGYLIRNRQPP